MSLFPPLVVVVGGGGGARGGSLSVLERETRYARLCLYLVPILSAAFRDRIHCTRFSGSTLLYVHRDHKDYLGTTQGLLRDYSGTTRDYSGTTRDKEHTAPEL